MTLIDTDRYSKDLSAGTAVHPYDSGDDPFPFQSSFLEVENQTTLDRLFPGTTEAFTVSGGVVADWGLTT
ncbi:hypothetical protein LR032_04860, partial [Candidatus Bipolaricaulota bacterium]|nr:hypothetical protein [Candidatus Bipolaricaulota bacterium]